MEDKIKSEFEFYEKLTKPLILHIPCSQDRYKATAWLTKLKDENVGEENLRISYLKLLILVLQRGKLIGIFADDPSSYDTLIDFSSNFNINEFARCMIERDVNERRETLMKLRRGEGSEKPPILFDYSSNLQEYVAAQDIPNFGIHTYYAFSKEPFTKWYQSDKVTIPKVITDLENIKEAPCYCTDVVENKTCVKKEIELGKKVKIVRPPANLLGEVTNPLIERRPPNWGSSILEARNHKPVPESRRCQFIYDK